MNPLIQGHSGTAPETSRNALGTSQWTNEDDSQSDPHPEAGIFHNQMTQTRGPENGQDNAYSSNWCCFLQLMLIFSNFFQQSVHPTDVDVKVLPNISAVEFSFSDIGENDCEITNVQAFFPGKELDKNKSAHGMQAVLLLVRKCSGALSKDTWNAKKWKLEANLTLIPLNYQVSNSLSKTQSLFTFLTDFTHFFAKTLQWLQSNA